MLISRYLGRVWSFAFQRFTIRTDAMQIVAASAIPALAPMLGIRNPAEANSEVLAYIGFATLAFIAIRLLCAPYFIWKEDQARLSELEGELARPERVEEEAGREHRIALRRELAEVLAREIAVAEWMTVPETFEQLYAKKLDEIMGNRVRLRELLSMLSYDVPLRVACFNLHSLCLEIMQMAGRREDASAALKRLWAQRKLTYKLIHRDDDVSDLVTMLEIENLIAEYGESFDSDESVTDRATQEALDVHKQAREAVAKLGPNVKLLGRQPNLSSSNRRKALNKEDGGKLTTR